MFLRTLYVRFKNDVNRRNNILNKKILSILSVLIIFSMTLAYANNISELQNDQGQLNGWNNHGGWWKFWQASDAIKILFNMKNHAEGAKAEVQQMVDKAKAENNTYNLEKAAQLEKQNQLKELNQYWNKKDN